MVLRFHIGKVLLELLIVVGDFLLTDLNPAGDGLLQQLANADLALNFLLEFRHRHAFRIELPLELFVAEGCPQFLPTGLDFIGAGQLPRLRRLLQQDFVLDQSIQDAELAAQGFFARKRFRQLAHLSLVVFLHFGAQDGLAVDLRPHLFARRAQPATTQQHNRHQHQQQAESAAHHSFPQAV